MSTATGPVVGGHLEVAWFDAVNHLTRVTSWLHAPVRLYAEYGIVLFAGVLLAAWWLARRSGDERRMTAALWAPFGALLALALNQPISNAVAEPRPYAALPHALVLVSRSTDFSFPSDHAVMAGAVAGGVLLAHRRLGLVALVMALLMAFARVYVGAHFPLDVVAGLVVGAVVAVGSLLLLRPVGVRLVRALDRTPLHVLLTAER